MSKISWTCNATRWLFFSVFSWSALFLCFKLFKLLIPPSIRPVTSSSSSLNSSRSLTSWFTWRIENSTWEHLQPLSFPHSLLLQRVKSFFSWLTFILSLVIQIPVPVLLGSIHFIESPPLSCTFNLFIFMPPYHLHLNSSVSCLA